ncbi:uncharacterized protein N7459_004239 [Penicillium hispanicum]|uniref:uncharacterized protein n=1 Tax=Penicillium hispanicum TaxID=1080232 RepID=UPI0025412B26|nr:uncharacterized protein N7459_004239 [Penicillium hispanicum]KAJ5584439.1 hypothetical protein N7459_004239 [Penicillium hispanicum]
MASDQSSLYGKPKTSSSKKREITSSSNLAFTTQLSSLIAQDTHAPSRGRPRPAKSAKSDLFTRHNKGAQKRAAADLEDDDRGVFKQAHKSSQDIGTIDDATLGRSKRRMQEKVRMYNDMKKGLYLAGDSSDEDGAAPPPSGPEDYMARLRRKEKEGLVDFDRKWADEERKRRDRGEESEESEDDDNASVISYEDEFGRSRRGTRAEAARAAKTKEEEANHGRSAQERWKPARPENLIHGVTVQSEAFNPDANVASHMAHLAARRDRSPTPPENVHYDADAEVRNRGTGFYAFSRDEGERKRQMEELSKAREETQRQRERASAKEAEYQAILDDRRRQIAELREKRMLQRLAKGLSNTLPVQRDP